MVGILQSEHNREPGHERRVWEGKARRPKCQKGTKEPIKPKQLDWVGKGSWRKGSPALGLEKFRVGSRACLSYPEGFWENLMARSTLMLVTTAVCLT